MVKIYHNPRCRKSREGLQVIEDSGKDFEMIKYLDDPISESELKKIINLLGIKPIELVRKNEAIWKSDYKGKVMNDSQIISAMVNNPKLIERPIVLVNDMAVIGRPADKIKTLIK